MRCEWSHESKMHIYDLTDWYVGHVSFIWQLTHIHHHICDNTQWYAWHDSSTWLDPWHIHVSFDCDKWLTHVSCHTQEYVIRATIHASCHEWSLMSLVRIHVRVAVCVAGCVAVCCSVLHNMTTQRTNPDKCQIIRSHVMSYGLVMSRIWMSHVTCMNVWFM